MIDSRFLDHEFDEESGFDKPHTPLAPKVKRGAGEIAGLAAVALGFLVFAISLFKGAFLGAWGTLLTSHFLMAAGASLYFIEKYKRLPEGIHHNDTMFSSTSGRGSIAWILAFVITGFYLILYFKDDIQRLWDINPIAYLVVLVDPLSKLVQGQPADQWFLYGFFYTLMVIVFGIRMIMRYRHNRYHLIRTLSVIFFQLVLGFLVPSILKLLQTKDYYFSYFWPLKPEYLSPTALSSAEGIVVFFFYWSLLMSFVATPILTYFYGKRWYCSWVCGCGGLAETLGDPWRQLSDKSTRAWQIERWSIYSVLVMIIVLTGTLWINSATEGDILGGYTQSFSSFYGLVIVQLFSGVVGVGFYPLLGSRVWCRFGCPMAAILGIMQRIKSRFRITTNGGQCMSCGNCSTYCEMGIDVRAYAQSGENILRASCVGCGVCSAVCPRGVLKLEGGSTQDRITDTPFTSFIRESTK